MTHPLNRLRRPLPPGVTDFSDRETVPMELLEPDPKIPQPEVVEFWNWEEAKWAYLDQAKRVDRASGAAVGESR